MLSTGVLLLGFGGPLTLDDVRPFMCNLMGREPSDALVASVCERYEAIGGGSPLPRIASEIATGLEVRLSDGGERVPVRVGMRYSDPLIGGSIAELLSLGCTRIVTVSLSPFESRVASGAYREAIETARAGVDDLEVVEAPLVSTLDAYAAFFARSAKTALAELADENGTVVAFTAHSLPESDLVQGDPYISGLQATAAAVASKLGLAPGVEGAGTEFGEGFSALGTAEGVHPWYLVYQSKGAKPGTWLGPELEALIAGVAKSGKKAIAVSPIGFMTDHMETLWDLDSVAAKYAAEKGLAFARAAVPNDDPAVLDAIAGSVTALL